MNEATALPGSAWVVAGIVLVGGAMAVQFRNVLHAIFGLAVCLFGIAILYLYLGSPFLAAMQVLIYIGGIIVAMVFAVMFSHRLDASRQEKRHHLLAIPPAVALLVALGLLIRSTEFGPMPKDRDWSLETVGRALLTHYNVVFEALSVVLLLAIVGAILIARKGER
jgi:NADH-quinone oxidoreductase subunit J